MPSTAAVGMIGGIASVMPGHKACAHQIRNCPADIGTTNRQDMLFVATGAGGVNVYSLKNK